MNISFQNKKLEKLLDNPSKLTRELGEDVARELHTVAGVARESHNHLVENLYISFLQHD